MLTLHPNRQINTFPFKTLLTTSCVNLLGILYNACGSMFSVLYYSTPLIKYYKLFLNIYVIMKKIRKQPLKKEPVDERLMCVYTCTCACIGKIKYKFNQ